MNSFAEDLCIILWVGWTNCLMFLFTGSYWIFYCLMPLLNHLSRYSWEKTLRFMKNCEWVELITDAALHYWIFHLLNVYFEARLALDTQQPCSYNWVDTSIIQPFIKISMGTCLVLNEYFCKSHQPSNFQISVPISLCLSCYSLQVLCAENAKNNNITSEVGKTKDIPIACQIYYSCHCWKLPAWCSLLMSWHAFELCCVDKPEGNMYNPIRIQSWLLFVWRKHPMHMWYCSIRLEDTGWTMFISGKVI